MKSNPIRSETLIQMKLNIIFNPNTPESILIRVDINRIFIPDFDLEYNSEWKLGSNLYGLESQILKSTGTQSDLIRIILGAD